jgi:hypothetical protein
MALSERVADLEARLASVVARLGLIEDMLHIPGV